MERSDLDKLGNNLNMLKRLLRELNIFKQEHKIFKEKFVFAFLD